MGQMPSALPLLLLGGAAVVVLGGKKKRSGRARNIPLDKPIQVPVDTPPPPVPAKGESGSGASKKVWRARQSALAYLNALGVCSCDPGTIDGVYGPKTKSALRGFQAAAIIPKTGKWDEKTDTAMTKMLVDAVKGIIEVPTKKKDSEPPKPLPSFVTTCPTSRYDVADNHFFGIRHLGLDSQSAYKLADAVARRRAPASGVLVLQLTGGTHTGIFEAEHRHQVVLNLRNINQLADGEQITKLSEPNDDKEVDEDGHRHKVTLRCMREQK